jgi:hypothetical protein
MVQVDPSHVAAKGTSWKLWFALLPTASHELTAGQETALKPTLGPPGVACADQEVPVQAAALFTPDGPSPTTSQ